MPGSCQLHPELQDGCSSGQWFLFRRKHIFPGAAPELNYSFDMLGCLAGPHQTAQGKAFIDNTTIRPDVYGWVQSFANLWQRSCKKFRWPVQDSHIFAKPHWANINVKVVGNVFLHQLVKTFLLKSMVPQGVPHPAMSMMRSRQAMKLLGSLARQLWKDKPSCVKKQIINI